MPSFCDLLDDTCFNRWNVPVPLPRTTNKIPVKNTLRINNFAVLWQPAASLHIGGGSICSSKSSRRWLFQVLS